MPLLCKVFVCRDPAWMCGNAGARLGKVVVAGTQAWWHQLTAGQRGQDSYRDYLILAEYVFTRSAEQ